MTKKRTTISGNNFQRFLLTLFVGTVACAVPCADAAPRQVAVALGSSEGDALTALGPPHEKIEQETKRRVIWKYKDGRTLTFNQGALTHDSRTQPVTQQKEAPLIKVESASPPEVKTPSKSSLSFTGKEIFKEFAKLESSEGEEEPKDSKKPLSSTSRKR